MNVTDSVIEYFKGMFYSRGEEVLPFLCSSSLSRMLFLSKYTKIESLLHRPQSEQDEMTAYVDSLFPDKTPEFKEDACKIIYTIGNLL